jgi:hypothetical protein
MTNPQQHDADDAWLDARFELARIVDRNREGAFLDRRRPEMVRHPAPELTFHTPAWLWMGMCIGFTFACWLGIAVVAWVVLL